MFDKIVITQDRRKAVAHFEQCSIHIHFDVDNKSATVYLPHKTVGIYSDVDVLALIWEIIIAPSIILEDKAYELQRRLANADEITQKIYLEDVA